MLRNLNSCQKLWTDGRLTQVLDYARYVTPSLDVVLINIHQERQCLGRLCAILIHSHLTTWHNTYELSTKAHHCTRAAQPMHCEYQYLGRLILD